MPFRKFLPVTILLIGCLSIPGQDGRPSGCQHVVSQDGASVAPLGTSVVAWARRSGGQQGWEANGTYWDLFGKASWDHPHLSSLKKGNLGHLRLPEERWAQRG